MKIFYFFILFLSILIIIIAKDDNELLVFKFKTFYPSIKKSNNINTTEYTGEDFINSFILSKLYLELPAGDKNEFDKGKNQILRTFIYTKTNSFIFRDSKKYDNTLCDFNATSSSSYNLTKHSLAYCESEQIFKIYTDIEFKDYIFHDFFIENYFCYNDSLCADVGVNNQISQKAYKQDFLYQLHKILNTSQQNIFFNYLDPTKEEGIFTFGLLPHNYSNNFNEGNIISFYSKNDYYCIVLDTITFDDKEYYKPDEKFNNFIDIEFSFEKEGIEFDPYFFDILKQLFFDEYINKGICVNDGDGFNSKIIFCYADKFGKNDIKKFPKIKFIKYSFNFNITFDNDDLFYFKDNKYFCKIYAKHNSYKSFVIGRIILKKYLIAFNADKKQVYFYIPKNNNNDEEQKSFFGKYGIIIILGFIIVVIIIYGLGILTGKVVYRGRKKKANELDDNYDYKDKDDNNNDNTKSLYNPKEEDE